MRFCLEKAFDGADASANLNSDAIDITNVFQVSVHVVATGTPTPVIKIQVSNDQVLQNGKTPTNWVDLPSATVTVTAAGSFLIPKTDVCYGWMRLVQTGGGTGTTTATVKTNGY